MTINQNLDPELQAMSSISTILASLDDDAKGRVLKWAIGKFNLSLGIQASKPQSGGTPSSEEIGSFGSLPELFDAANPSTGAEKALVIALWLQQTGQEDFSSQSVNTELKHLGHGIANITAAFTDLISQKYALQIQKSGKSQQSRKKYKLTRRGMLRVQELISGTPSNEQ